MLKDELNKIGTFKALINFHSEVKANISIKIDKIEATDIDDSEDFIIAEILYKELRLKKSK